MKDILQLGSADLGNQGMSLEAGRLTNEGNSRNPPGDHDVDNAVEDGSIGRRA